MSKKNEVRLNSNDEWEDFYDEEVKVQNDHPYINESYIEENKGFVHFESMKNLVDTENDQNQKEVIQNKQTSLIGLIEDNRDNDKVSIKEIRLKHALSMEFIKTSAEVLNMGDVDENTMMSLEDAEKITAECHRLNKEKANANNPTYNRGNNEQKILTARVTMADLMAEYDVGIDVIKEIAYKLYITEIWNEKSYTSDINIKRITAELEKQKNSTLEKSLSTDNDFKKLLEDNFLIFIDTSSLMNTNMLELIDTTIIPLLEKSNNVVYIVESVEYEISKKLEYPDDDETYEKALIARGILDKLGKKSLYNEAVTDSVTKKFADAEFISTFCNLRLKYNLCLITNDNKRQKQGGLAGSIMRLAEDPNINGIKEIKVFSVNKKEGKPCLVEFSLHRDSNFKLHDNPPLRVRL